MNITFPPELPVSERRDEIAKAISDHQVVIVAGETGSGKTTQLPKICLALGRGQDRVIGHTQPRRIAARSVADRIADELGVELGAEVGYQVRFTDQTSAQTRVKVMTDGVLLNELQRDRDLRRYDTIIIDEAHERSLNIDFLMGYLKRLLPRRPDLKVIITSATIDPESFAAHFADREGNPAPIVEVSGRTYPVEVRYRPLTDIDRVDEEGEVLVRDLTDAICDGVDELMTATEGDVLVFLPGEREIRDAATALEKRTRKRPLEIVPLYSRLTAAEQHKVFAAHTQRRVVLATNVAETSLTVPGITGVIDTGLARISRWSLRTKVQRLPIEPISQASARQRSGRCGRTEAGIAIRLYSEEDFEARPAFTDAEILRTNLASVILQMTALRLGDVARFPFLDPPDQRSVRDGVALLGELGALREGRLSGVGRRLARLPVDPRLGRMLIEADRLGCLREVIVIVAALSGQDPRERPEDKKPQSDQAHARFRDPRSDFVSWLNLWNYLQEQQKDLGSSAFRRLCRDEYLNFLRVREWQDLERQLRQVAKETRMKVPRSSNTPDADSIHQAVLSGLLSHIGVLDREAVAARRQGKRLGDYLGARGARFSIFPGSGVAKARPDVVMAAELVETSALWGRQVAAIDPAWAERLGGDLVKRTWSEPHWSKRRASAQAYERVTLYGVPLVTDRLVALGSRDPQTARELFIRHALLAGEWATQHRFLKKNAALLLEASELEDRARRRDIVVDEETLFDFYDARIPAEVVSGAHFDSWWKQERRQRGDLLTFDPAMLVREEAVGEADAFPDVWRDGERSLELRYRFEPGHRDDGVTVDIPLGALGGLGADQFSWQVAGLREELVTALLRGLPKNLRVHVVPVPDTTRAFLAEVAPGEESLTAALSRFIRARKGVFVPEDAWDLAKLPSHLLPTFRVLDADGRVVSEGKDLDELRAPLAADFDAAVRDVASSALPRITGASTWTFGDVPESFRTVRAGHEIEAFPALVDEETGVGLDVFGRRDWALARHRRGVRRLIALQHPGLPDDLLGSLDTQQKLILASARDSARTLAEHCVLAAIDGAMRDVSAVRTAGEFEALRDSTALDLMARAQMCVEHLVRTLKQAIEVDRAVSGRVDLAALSAMADMQAQYTELMKPGFVAIAGPWLQHYPRYLSGILRRAEKLNDLARDRLAADRVATFQNLVTEGYRALPEGQPPTAELEHGRWLVEEFRVSLWAQQLGTSEPVSERRLSKLLHG